MPRLIAGSVAENRDLRQSALVSAAQQIAVDQGIAAVTVAAVAKRAGLSRSSVYAYFDSAADLLADVIADELDAMAQALTAAVADVADPAMVIHRWITFSLDYIADGRHALARSAGQVNLPPTRRAQIGDLHRRLMDPLVSALTAAGARDAVRAAQQVAAVLDVAVRRIESGADAGTEAAAAISFALGGLRPA
ncbi:MAG: TetR/AcrR family transcriptional regulator [Actinomycetales bacterium]|nr:TetR/AcrR family transcriptional regulator [Actinomycetales bacterium]